MLKRRARWSIHMKLNNFRVNCTCPHRFNELTLAVHRDPFILGIMQGQEWDLAPMFQVIDGIHGCHSGCIKHGAVLLPTPTSRGAFHYCGIKCMRAREANQRRHAARAHAAQGALAAEVLAGSVEIRNNCIKFANHLLDHPERFFGRLSQRIQAFAVPGQINSTGGNARARQSEVTAGVKFFGDGAPVHPHQYRRGAQHCAGVAIKVWMHQQRRHFAAPKPYRPREGKNARWKLVEWLRHARGNVAGRILDLCIHA